MRKRSASLAGLLLLATLVLGVLVAACGGGGGNADEAKIEEAITESVTSTDPAKCTETMTQRFLEQTSDESGKAAVKDCEAKASDTSNDPESVKVSGIHVGNGDGTASVAFVGGSFNGQTLDVALVEEEGQWKLDELVGFATLDKDALATTFEKAFEEASSQITPEQIKCIGDKIRKADDPTVEELVLSGSSQPLVEFAETCE